MARKTEADRLTQAREELALLGPEIEYTGGNCSAVVVPAWDGGNVALTWDGRWYGAYYPGTAWTDGAEPTETTTQRSQVAAVAWVRDRVKVTPKRVRVRPECQWVGCQNVAVKVRDLAGSTWHVCKAHAA